MGSSVGIQRIVLDNGLVVLIEPRPYTKKATILVGTRVGSVDESKKLNGGSHFLEHLYFKSNRFRSAEDIVRDLEYSGMVTNAYTTWKYTSSYNKMMGRHLGQAAQILSEAVFNWEFDPPEFEKERKVILTELHNNINDPSGFTLNNLFIPGLFKGTPLEKTIDGTQESISCMKQADLEKFKRLNYIPSNMAISLVGKVTNRGLFKVRELFSSVESGKIPRRSKIVKKPRQQEIFRSRKDLTQSYLCLGWQVSGFQNEDTQGLDVLANYLGSGLSSRLFRELRIRRGIGYGVSCVYIPFDTEGILAILVPGFDPKRVDETRKVLFEVVEDVQKNLISKKELLGTQNHLISNYEEMLEDISSRAMLLLEQEIYKKPYDYRKKEELVRNVGVEDVRRVARKYLDDRFTLAVLNSK